MPKPCYSVCRLALEVKNILLSFGKQEFLKHFKFKWKPDLEGKDIPGYQSKMVLRVYIFVGKSWEGTD